VRDDVELQQLMFSVLHYVVCVGAYKRTPVMPRRNPPPPPREESTGSSHGASKAGDTPLGAFWATQHAQSSRAADIKNPLFDEEPIKASPSSKHGQNKVDINTGTPGDRRGHSGQAVQKSTPNNSISNNAKGSQSSLKTKAPHSHPMTNSVKDPFNSFVADFDSNNLHAVTSADKASDLELELSRLKEQLKKTTLEKEEMIAKYEKLSAICRSQRQEIQELKRTLAETTPPLNKVSSRTHDSVSQVMV
jgi:AP2-associated kinase